MLQLSYKFPLPGWLVSSQHTDFTSSDAMSLQDIIGARGKPRARNVAMSWGVIQARA